MVSVIPPITHPLGAVWRQPELSAITITDEWAVMDNATLQALTEYSSSLPTATYPGKMWKAYHAGRWWLRWYGEGPTPTTCSLQIRKIQLTPEDPCTSQFPSS